MAFSGSLFLLKASDGGTVPVLTTLSMCQSNSISINGETVDVTNKASGGWREILDGGGITSMSISASGIVLLATHLQDLVTRSIARTLHPYEVVVPGLGTFAGDFQLPSFSSSGENAADAKFETTLESSGVIVFTAEV